MFRLLKTVGSIVPLVLTPWVDSKSNNPPLPDPPPSYSSPFVSSVRLLPYEDIEKEVHQLIDSLGSKVFLEREYASERLLELPLASSKLFSQIVKALSTEYKKDWKEVDHEKARRLEEVIRSIQPNEITELILNKQIDEDAVLMILNLKGYHDQFKNAALKAEGVPDKTIQGFQKGSPNYGEIRQFFVLMADQPPVNNNKEPPNKVFSPDLSPGDNFYPVNPQWRQINPIIIDILAASPEYIVQRYIAIYPQTTSNALEILANTTEEEVVSLDVIRHDNVTPKILNIYIKQFPTGKVKQSAEERLEQIEEKAKQDKILKELNIKPGTGLIGLP